LNQRVPWSIWSCKRFMPDCNYFLYDYDTVTILSEQLCFTTKQSLSLRGWIPFRKTMRNKQFKLHSPSSFTRRFRQLGSKF
jgi:hypothetical protein